MTKIVYCIPQLYRAGGIERIVTIKANFLAEVYGYDVTIVAANQKGKEAFYEVSKKVKIVDLGLDYDGTLALPIAKRLVNRYRLHSLHRKRLERLLMELRPDITVSTFAHEAAYLPDIKDGSKKVLEFHFCRRHKRLMADAFGFSWLTKQAYYWKCRYEEHKIVQKYDQFVVLTKEDMYNWRPIVPNVKYIPNILPFDLEKQGALQNKRVIAVGRLDAQKGFDRLIKIWKKVNERFSDWCLYIYGEGQDKEMLQSMIKTSGLQNNIKLQGITQNICLQYLESSIFVMTSRYEGMPMTMLEAMSLGLPLVSYDFPCGPSDLITDGMNGFLISNGDENAFADALCKLMQDKELRLSMGERSKKISQSYKKEVLMDLWNTLFSKINIDARNRI